MTSTFRLNNPYRLNNPNLKGAFELLDLGGEGEIDVPAVLDNLVKIGYDKNHPEIYDLFQSLGEGRVNYPDFIHTLQEIMNDKEGDSGLQRMFDLLIYDPKIQVMDFDTLKRISTETGNVLTDAEVKFALNEIGDGKKIPIESFVKFMKSE